MDDLVQVLRVIKKQKWNHGRPHPRHRHGDGLRSPVGQHRHERARVGTGDHQWTFFNLATGLRPPGRWPAAAQRALATLKKVHWSAGSVVPAWGQRLQVDKDGDGMIPVPRRHLDGW